MTLNTALRITLIFGIFLFIKPKALCQYGNVRNGFVILESGDTLRGKLKVLTEAKSCAKIQFTNLDGKKLKFKDKEVKAYRRGEQDYVKKSYVRPFEISNMTGYMKLIDRGEINLYEFTYIVTTPSTPNPNGVSHGGFRRSENDYYLERENNFSLVTRIEFRKVVLPYISDNPNLSKKVKNRELKYKDLRSLVKKFNASVD